MVLNIEVEAFNISAATEEKFKLPYFKANLSFFSIPSSMWTQTSFAVCISAYRNILSVVLVDSLHDSFLLKISSF